MPRLYANNAYGTLNTGIATGDTAIALVAGAGARFPNPTGGDYFNATLVGYDGNNNENAWEIVKVTARASDALTVVRAQEGSTAAAWPTGTRIELRMTASAATAFEGKLDKAGGAMSGKLNAVATDYTVTALGSISAGQTLDLSSASEFTATIAASLSFAFSNAPAAGRAQVVYLRLTNAGAFTITWPANTKFAGGAAPTLTSAGVDLLGVKYDSATSTYMVFVIGKDVK